MPCRSAAQAGAVGAAGAGGAVGDKAGLDCLLLDWASDGTLRRATISAPDEEPQVREFEPVISETFQRYQCG